MKRLKRKISVALVVTSILFTSVFSVNAIHTDKNEGVITTFFHEESGTLIVSGEGEIKDLYPRATKNALCDTVTENDIKIKHLVIDDGITSISNSFNDMHNLQDVSFPATLERIYSSFNDCDKVKSVDFPKSLKVIGSACFNDCDGISDLHFNDDLEEINYENAEAISFNSLDSLETLYIPQYAGVNGAFSDCAALYNIYYEDPYCRGVRVQGDKGYLPSFVNCAEDVTIYTRKQKLDLFTPEDEKSYSGGYDNPLGWLSKNGGPNVVYLENVPGEMRISNSDADVQLSWDCVKPGVTYNIYRAVSGLVYVPIASSRKGEFTDTTVKSGVVYKYRIVADDYCVESDSILALASPVLKSAVYSDSKKASLEWSEVEGAKGYYVYRSETGCAGTWTRIANIESGKTISYMAEGLEKEKEYYFCVRSYSSNTVSTGSNKKLLLRDKG